MLDDLTYHYYDTLRNNRLEYIADAVSTSNFLLDLETQNPGNYSYDSVGNMISDASRTLTVQYTYSNRPKFINFANGRSLKMRYNPFGYRFFSGASNQDGDIFLYSSQGQLVAKYRVSGDVLKLNYLPIYEGSKRIGIVEPEDVSWLDCPELMPCDVVAVDPCMIGVIGQPMPMPLAPCKKDSSLKADRKYEIVDHLGNVRVVIANQRIPVDTNGDSLVDYYKPVVISVHDYYPFGWEKQLTTVEPYPFTYQGQLFDRDLGWQYYRYRNYDPKVGRFWQVEPLIDKYPWLGYVFSENKVTYGIEMEGREAVVFFVSAEVMGGWVYGLGLEGKVGVAFDRVGVTVFTGLDAIYGLNQNLYEGSKDPKIVAGAYGGIDIGGLLFPQAKTFEDVYSTMMLALPFQVKAKKYLGFSAIIGGGGSSSVFGGAIGVGEGFGFKIAPMGAPSLSFSFTYEEAAKLSFYTGAYTAPVPVFGAINILMSALIYRFELTAEEPIMEDNEVIGFKRTLRVYNRLTGKLVDKFTLKSNAKKVVTKEGKVKYESTGVWKSEKYLEEEKAMKEQE